MELEMFNNGKENQTISSREIAEITGKMHKNVLSDCDKLNESYQKMGLAEILAGVYFHENTGKGQVYFVNKFLNDSDEIILFQEN